LLAREAVIINNLFYHPETEHTVIQSASSLRLLLQVDIRVVVRVRSGQSDHKVGPLWCQSVDQRTPFRRTGQQRDAVAGLVKDNVLKEKTRMKTTTATHIDSDIIDDDISIQSFATF
jgi:hypothetical protein